MRSSALLAAVAALAITACNDTATTSDAEIAASETAEPAEPAAPATTAADFVRMAAVSDMFEIESSRLALAQSDSDSVKRFAQQMIDEHTRSSETLKSTVRAMGSAVTVPTALDAAHAAKLADLRAATEANFDQLYWQQQRVGHDAALALHRGYAASGDTPELRTIATNMVPIVEGHRGMIMQAMAGGGAMGDGAVSGGAMGSGATRASQNTGASGTGRTGATRVDTAPGAMPADNDTGSEAAQKK